MARLLFINWTTHLCHISREKAFSFNLCRITNENSRVYYQTPIGLTPATDL